MQSPAAEQAAESAVPQRINRDVLAVFAGLMLGTLVSALNLTLVAPALPTIVAELGGLADYTWIPIAAMTTKTITTANLDLLGGVSAIAFDQSVAGFATFFAPGE